MDAYVENHGSIFLVRLFTQRARDWIDENVQKDAQFFDDALVVERLYIGALVAVMIEEGLEVE